MSRSTLAPRRRPHPLAPEGVSLGSPVRLRAGHTLARVPSRERAKAWPARLPPWPATASLTSQTRRSVADG
jgi:hypothetical protein